MTVSPDDVHETRPAEPTGTGVLLLAGSSGRIETARAELLAAHGAHVRAIRWFGGRGQRPAPHEVPILGELEALRRVADRVTLFGTSFGAEAALISATLTHVDATVAVAPTSVVWPGEHEGGWSSHWTHRGEPLAFVPFDPAWEAAAEPPECRGLYAASLARDPDAAARAEIPVERISGSLTLVVGGDDRVWPSDRFAASIRARRARAGLETSIVSHPRAGHRLLLPGEEPVAGGVSMARGGDQSAERELGAAAWPVIRAALSLR